MFNNGLLVSFYRFWAMILRAFAWGAFRHLKAYAIGGLVTLTTTLLHESACPARGGPYLKDHMNHKIGSMYHIPLYSQCGILTRNNPPKVPLSPHGTCLGSLSN